MLRIYIDASALAEDKLSGIGHSVLEIVRQLEVAPGYGSNFQITLVGAFDRISKLKRWDFDKVSYMTLPLPTRLLNLIWKFDLLPPLDLFSKKGVFIFPNYKNLRMAKSKSITYIHDISFVLFPQYVEPKNQAFLAKFMGKWIGRTNMIVADSNSAKSDILAEYQVDDDKIKVIHHGVDREFYSQKTEDEIAEAKEKYGLTKGKYILFVGNIEPRKNIEGLIEAYEKLSESIRQSHQLVLVGGLGWLNESIIDRIKTATADGLDILKVSKYVVDEDLPALYSGASLLAMPSHYEGFGLPLVQAMSCGTPVVAGNNSSMKEVVGEAGVLVDAENTGDIARGMASILQDKAVAEKFIEMGLQRAEKFSWKNTAESLLDLCRKVGGETQ